MVPDAVRAHACIAGLPLPLLLRDLTAETLIEWAICRDGDCPLFALPALPCAESARASAFRYLLREAFPQKAPEADFGRTDMTTAVDAKQTSGVAALSSSGSRHGHILPPRRVLRRPPLLPHPPVLALVRPARAR